MRVEKPINANTTALERAFDIARLGRCETVEDIKRQLQGEGLGLSQNQVAGPVLTRRLLGIARRARAAAREVA